MISYEAILEASEIDDYDDSIGRIKSLAAQTLRDADGDATLLATEHFNHSYLPDFVMQWDNRPDRFVFLRASSYAEEIEEDVVALADRHPVFLQLSRFRSFDDKPEREAIDSLNRSAGSAKSLVTSLPAMGYLDDSPRTGRMLSSFVVRGGKGLVEDTEAQTIAETVESGFVGALESDRAKTANAMEVVEGLLDPRSNAEFSQLFEAAWISGGALATEFPGGVTQLGSDLSAEILAQLLGVVPENVFDFWDSVGNSITIESFQRLHLVGDQPQLQRIMKNAITRLVASHCSVRRTQRSDQESDPFIWQVDSGLLSLRGGGYQTWVGPVPKQSKDIETLLSVDEPPSLQKLSSRSDNAGLIVSDIGVSDDDDIGVRFSSPGDRDVATSDLVSRVTESLGASVRVNDVVVRVNGKSVPVNYANGNAKARKGSRLAVSELIWNGWNLLAETSEDVREQLEQVLGIDDGGDGGPGGESGPVPSPDPIPIDSAEELETVLDALADDPDAPNLGDGSSIR